MMSLTRVFEIITFVNLMCRLALESQNFSLWSNAKANIIMKTVEYSPTCECLADCCPIQ